MAGVGLQGVQGGTDADGPRQRREERALAPAQEPAGFGLEGLSGGNSQLSESDQAAEDSQSGSPQD